MGRGRRGCLPAVVITLALLLTPASPALAGAAAAGSVLTVGAGAAYASIGAAVAAARAGDTIRVAPGLYPEHLTIDRSLTLIGTGEAIIDGGGQDSVVTIAAPHTTFEGFHVRGTGINLDHEDTAIAVIAPGTVIRGNVISDALFGIYLKNAPDARVEGNRVGGKNLPLPLRGDPIKAWYSHRFQMIRNVVEQGRDVIAWYTDGCLIQDNRIAGGRYGLHFMFSNDCTVTGNTLQGNSVGAYVMYGTGLTFRGNRFIDHRGPSGYGLGLKEVNSVTAEDNWFVRNRVGVFADTTPMDPDSENRLHRNMFVGNDIGLELLPSDHRNTFWENSFVDNQEQVAEAGGGRITGNAWSVGGRGNYWSDYTGYDAGGEGVGRLPYHDQSAFAFLADQNARLRWFIYSPAAAAVDLAARAFPVVEVAPKVEDTAPLTHPVVPAGNGPEASAHRGRLLSLSLLMLSGAALLLALVGRPGRWRMSRVYPAWEGRQP